MLVKPKKLTFLQLKSFAKIWTEWSYQITFLKEIVPTSNGKT